MTFEPFTSLQQWCHLFEILESMHNLIKYRETFLGGYYFTQRCVDVVSITSLVLGIVVKVIPQLQLKRESIANIIIPTQPYPKFPITHPKFPTV